MVELTLRVIHDKQRISLHERFLNDLSRIYPICSYCKKVRDASGEWVGVEEYIHDIAGTRPTHGICPECFAKLENRMTVPGGPWKPAEGPTR